VKTSRNRRGAAAIEFAMVLPVLIALLFGIIEYGWIFFQQSNILAAAREGARYGVTFEQGGSPTPTSAAQTRVSSVLTSYGIDSASATVSATQSGSSPSEVLTVQIVVPYDPLIGLVPTPDNLTGTMTMLLELQD
jgi:Flp pilus assembly protein TadG